MSLASADPTIRLIDLVDLARCAIGRLAREQDAANERTYIADTPTRAHETRAAALATSRGEAARAMHSLFIALPGGVPEPVMVAHTQRDTIRGCAPIPSATLREWEAAWAAYAETLAADEPEGSDLPPMPLPTPDGVVMP